MSQKVKIDKIASVVCRMNLSRVLEVTPHMEARSGHGVVVRVLPEGKSKQELELADGRMIRLFGGDILVGALGRRRALRGFVGDVPDSIQVGDQLAVLNRGGVIGANTARDSSSEGPLPCEVVGMPLLDGAIPNIRDFAIPDVSSLAGRKIPPVVIVSGTSMQSGKTSFLAEIIQTLTKKGLSVAAGKLTGVACLRDLLSMQDNGAIRTASFQDAGYPSTAGMDVATLVATSKAVIAYLAEASPELILLELGDGLVGDYGVTDVLMDREIRDTIQVHAFCANDLAGAWGGQRYLAEHGFGIDLFSGPVTDNRVGIDYLEAEFHVPAINACRHPARTAEAVINLLSLRKQMVS
jgi:hypothetical protein